MASREDIKIPSSKKQLPIAISTYFETGNIPKPVIVMGHRIGGIKDVGIPPFATGFATYGYAAVTFDYLYFGQSGGEPRNLMDIPQQLQDFRDVITWVRQKPDKFDVDRIVVWGTSFGGMHTTALLAEDHQLAGGIAQCPCVDALEASKKVPFLKSLSLTSLALRDYGRSLFGGKPVYVALAGDGLPGSPPAIMTGPEAFNNYKRSQSMHSDIKFSNQLTARSLLSFASHRPIQRIHLSTKPYLIVLPTWDEQAPLDAAERAVELAPLGESLRVDGGHFDLYFPQPAFKENIAGQLKFLQRILG